MSPKKRLKSNLGLPQRWRFRAGAYYYRVPEGLEYLWDGKKEFLLGHKLSDAYREYADRVERGENIRTVPQLVDRYLLEVTPDKSQSWQKNEHLYAGRIRIVFDGVAAADVEPMHVYQFMDAASQKYGPTTANHMVGLLSHIYTKAIEWGVVREHPIKGKVVKRKVTVKRRVPEYDEIQAALACANPTIKAYVDLKLLTGLRMTDMLSLDRSDIKEDGLHITPSKTSTSTGKSLIFEWDEGGVLWGALEAAKALNKRKQFADVRKLFCTAKGQPYIKDDKSCNAFQSMWQRWQNKAIKQGLIESRFSEKSLRNRVGSDADTAESAAEMLAHSSTQTTRKHYRNSASKVKPMIRKPKSMGRQGIDGEMTQALPKDNSPK